MVGENERIDLYELAFGCYWVIPLSMKRDNYFGSYKLRWYHDIFVLMRKCFFIGGNIMVYFILFFLLFLVLFSSFKLYFGIKIKRKKLEGVTSIFFFVRRYNLDRKKLVEKKFLGGISCINAFIIAFVGTLIMYLDIVWEVNYFIELFIGFLLMFFLLYAMYEIYGKKLNKKWGIKNGNK